MSAVQFQDVLCIFLGASNWPNSEIHKEAVGTRQSADALLQYFLDNNVPNGQICNQFDSEETSTDQILKVGQFLSERSAPGRCILVFYSGHGVRLDPTDDYYFYAQSTQDELVNLSGIPWKSLSSTIIEHANGATVYCFIDACFAASAAAIDATIGFTLLTASPSYDVAKTRPDAQYTVFSEALLTVLRDGVPNETDTFTLRSICECMISYIKENLDTETTAYPKPEVHSPGQQPDPANLPFLPNPSPGQGAILPRSKVFEGPLIDQQQFAIEVLDNHVMLGQSDGRVRLTVDRSDSSFAIYSQEGKEALYRAHLNEKSQRESASISDSEAHRFLMRNDSQFRSYKVPQRHLRWASGGVLSIVRWRGRTWVPFFFRDTKPWGWNISLGASERQDDLTDPWSFALREFLEETLVLDRPPMEGRLNTCRPFAFDRLNVQREIENAEMHSSQSRKQRHEKDHMHVFMSADGRAIDVDIMPTGTELIVINDDSRIPTVRRNVLVSINAMELGIEVIKVIKYSLADDNYMLDGEIFDPDGKSPELARIPIALIALSHLERAFGDYHNLAYEGDDAPSVRSTPISSDDIHIFDYDVRRRKAIAEGQVPDSTEWERVNFQKWLKTYGDYFFDENGDVTTANACPVFTPAAAKLVSYFLADRARSIP